MYTAYTIICVEPIRYGSWCGRELFLSYQDIIIAIKNRKERASHIIPHQLQLGPATQEFSAERLIEEALEETPVPKGLERQKRHSHEPRSFI